MRSAAMLSLLVYFLEQLQFSRTPAELPRSSVLFALLFGLDWWLHAITLEALGQSDPGVRALVRSVLLSALLAALFHQRGRLDRLLQSLCAIYGAALVLGIFASVIAVFAHSVERSAGPALLVFVGLLISILLFWFLALLAHILKQALSLQFWQSTLLALLLAGVLVLVDGWIFGWLDPS
jgi:hypothetical protein